MSALLLLILLLLLPVLSFGQDVHGTFIFAGHCKEGIVALVDSRLGIPSDFPGRDLCYVENFDKTIILGESVIITAGQGAIDGVSLGNIFTELPSGMGLGTLDHFTMALNASECLPMNKFISIEKSDGRYGLYFSNRGSPAKKVEYGFLENHDSLVMTYNTDLPCRTVASIVTDALKDVQQRSPIERINTDLTEIYVESNQLSIERGNNTVHWDDFTEMYKDLSEGKVPYVVAKGQWAPNVKAELRFRYEARK